MRSKGRDGRLKEKLAARRKPAAESRAEFKAKIAARYATTPLTYEERLHAVESIMVKHGTRHGTTADWFNTRQTLLRISFQLPALDTL